MDILKNCSMKKVRVLTGKTPDERYEEEIPTNDDGLIPVSNKPIADESAPKEKFNYNAF